MLTINSSVNFLVYCYMSNTFRRIFYSWINRILGAKVMQEVMQSETSIAQTQANLVTGGTFMQNILDESPCHPENFSHREHAVTCNLEEQSPLQGPGTSPDLCFSSGHEHLQLPGSRTSDEELQGESDSQRMCRSMDTFVDSDVQEQPTLSEQNV